MRKIIFLILIIPEFLFSQECNCIDNFSWLKKTFEENDAGYPWIIEKKGLENYQAFCDSIQLIAKKSIDIFECQQILSDWTKYMRKGHIGIYINMDNSQKNDDSGLSDAEIIEKYSNTESVLYDSSLINQLEYVDNLQGIWKSDNYIIGIIKDTLNSEREYVGFIISSGIPQWQPKQVKIEMFKKDEELIANYYMQDHSIRKFKVEQLSDNKIKMGSVFLIRHRSFSKNKIDSLEWKITTATNPMIFELSDKTMLLRIPSFKFSYKSAIDNILKEYKEVILTHDNLVLDLRDNGGGSDGSYRNLIPFLYTNPINNINVEYLSTPLNNSHWSGYDKKSFLIKLILKNKTKKLNKNLGKYVKIWEKEFFVTELKEVYKKPRRVYILVNENCASTTEQFLLASKQSTKVKIYGKQTFGALDVSNVRKAISPDKMFALSYCVTRTLRPAKHRIDGVGIKPDVIIPVTISSWINYIQTEIEKN